MWCGPKTSKCHWKSHQFGMQSLPPQACEDGGENGHGYDQFMTALFTISSSNDFLPAFSCRIWNDEHASVVTQVVGLHRYVLLSPPAAIIEHVRDGSVVRAQLLPDHYLVTVMLSGVKVGAAAASFPLNTPQGLTQSFIFSHLTILRLFPPTTPTHTHTHRPLRSGSK